MSDINWDDAPEGATHYDNREDVYPWLMADDNGNKYWHFNCWVKYANDIGVNESISAKPVTSPIYTQDMADNGELPSIGMEVEFRTTFFTTQTSNSGTCEIIAYFGDKVWINIIDFDCVINIKVIDFNPITPTIELVDGKAYQFDCDLLDDCMQGIYRKMNNKFYNYNGDFGIEYCTNIKLLEVRS